MSRLEVVLFWVTVFSYVLSFFLQLTGLMRSRKRTEKAADILLFIGVAMHTCTLFVRGVSGGRIPVADAYELDLLGSWLCILVYLCARWRGNVDCSIGLVVVPATFLCLGHGMSAWSESAPMGPAYRSAWLVVHVLFAWVAFGCFAISAGAAALLLMKLRMVGQVWLVRIPATESLDATSYRYAVMGYVGHAVMLASGAIWAKALWGEYWGWDPLETWSLLTFLFYSFYLHVRRLRGWRTERTAWLAALGLIVLSISFWGVSWFVPSVHPGV